MPARQPGAVRGSESIATLATPEYCTHLTWCFPGRCTLTCSRRRFPVLWSSFLSAVGECVLCHPIELFDIEPSEDFSEAKFSVSAGSGVDHFEYARPSPVGSHTGSGRSMSASLAGSITAVISVM